MRTDWDTYFLDLADLVATRSTCDRLHVGCVLVRDKRIISTGYNGSLAGEGHCDDVGHHIVGGHCVRTIHAEANAVLQCAKFGVSTEATTAYVTHTPCPKCSHLMYMAGVKRFVFRHEYPPKE